MAENGSAPLDDTVADVGPPLHFGESPLPQTVAAAAAIRRISALLLSLEHPHPAVDTMIARMAEWEGKLAAAASPDPAPRVGAHVDAPSQRVYLDHAFDIGAFNPCFPEYVFDHIDTDSARGRITFPLVHEGPPGLVHGGFLGVLFDAVIQHQSCAAGLAGKTRSMDITYRRPTPILVELDFDITRAVQERGIESTARLLRDGEVLCSAIVRTVAVPLDRLTTTRYGKRQARI
jgi:acyl-coenzyme A thioesterase PaaI-like protein